MIYLLVHFSIFSFESKNIVEKKRKSDQIKSDSNGSNIKMTKWIIEKASPQLPLAMDVSMLV